MHLSLNIVMLVVILIVIVPFAWFILADKSAILKKKKTFQNIAKEQHVKPSETEYWNNTCLAYDAQDNVLLYINSGDSDTKVEKIKLDEVKKCAINKTTKDYKSGGQHYSEMSHLDLVFTFLSDTAPLSIALYDVNENFSQNQEMTRAEKWLAFIDRHKFNKDNTSVA